MATAATTARIFRITLEVAGLDPAVNFYSELLGAPGQRHPGMRHYFDCGGVILTILDASIGGTPPTLNAKSLYFSVPDIEAVHARAKKLNALAPYKVHGQSAGDIIERPWGERSFYVLDPAGNDLCFVADGTQYV
jgi:catechol 2,3-dioxygenase-like lactoylglutathione lyase family enzyme